MPTQDVETLLELPPSCAFWDGWPSERALHSNPVHQVRVRVHRSNLPPCGNSEQTLSFEVCAACVAALFNAESGAMRSLVRAYLGDPGAEVLAQAHLWLSVDA